MDHRLASSALATAVVASAVPLLTLVTACGDSSSPVTPSAPSASGTDGGGVDGGTLEAGEPLEAGAPPSGGTIGTDAGSPSCNTLDDDAATVMLQISADTPPVGTGGAVSDGAYALSGFTLYDAALAGSGISQAISIEVVISGATWQLATSGASSVLGAAAQTATFMPSGSMFQLAPTCPAGGQGLAGTYTATASSLTLLGTTPATGAATTGLTFTKM